MVQLIADSFCIIYSIIPFQMLKRIFFFTKRAKVVDRGTVVLKVRSSALSSCSKMLLAFFPLSPWKIALFQLVIFK